MKYLSLIIAIFLLIYLHNVFNRSGLKGGITFFFTILVTGFFIKLFISGMLFTLTWHKVSFILIYLAILGIISVVEGFCWFFAY